MALHGPYVGSRSTVVRAVKGPLSYCSVQAENDRKIIRSAFVQQCSEEQPSKGMLSNLKRYAHGSGALSTLLIYNSTKAL